MMKPRLSSSLQPGLAVAALLLLSACQNAQQAVPLEALPLAQSEPASLAESQYELLPAGSVVEWRDLDSGKTLEENVEAPQGLMMQSRIGARRSYAYLPDPWADNENTREDDVAPIFPFSVGKTVTFTRHPEAGLMVDTVTVVRSETLALPMGKVDTYAIETKSRSKSGSWAGTSTVWYAPSLHWYVQMLIQDNEGDHRRRQLLKIKTP